MDYDRSVPRFRDVYPLYDGESLEDVTSRIAEEGATVVWSDLRTTLQTTRHKMHGVYVIIFTDHFGWNLLSGTYNYLCTLEGEESLFHAQIKHTPALQSDERWSLWDNPMRNRRQEAWDKMWKTCRSFRTERECKEYIKKYMKNWDDIGSTLVWARS